MSLYHVRMTLARDPEFPSGSHAHGYDLVIPLDDKMMLDTAEWGLRENECHVTRFWQGETTRHGMLKHRGRKWFLDYEPARNDDDEPFFKLEQHSFKEGEYLTVTEADGKDRTFKIGKARLLSDWSAA